MRAIASQNNLRMGQELYAFGGGVIARKDRTDINRLADIRDKVVEAVSISGLGACQMQWRELQTRGLEFLSKYHRSYRLPEECDGSLVRASGWHEGQNSSR